MSTLCAGHLPSENVKFNQLTCVSLDMQRLDENKSFSHVLMWKSRELTNEELEANRLPKAEPEHRDGVCHELVSSGQGAHAGEHLV